MPQLLASTRPFQLEVMMQQDCPLITDSFIACKAIRALAMEQYRQRGMALLSKNITCTGIYAAIQSFVFKRATGSGSQRLPPPDRFLLLAGREFTTLVFFSHKEWFLNRSAMMGAATNAICACCFNLNVQDWKLTATEIAPVGYFSDDLIPSWINVIC